MKPIRYACAVCSCAPVLSLIEWSEREAQRVQRAWEFARLFLRNRALSGATAQSFSVEGILQLKKHYKHRSQKGPSPILLTKRGVKTTHRPISVNAIEENFCTKISHISPVNGSCERLARIPGYVCMSLFCLLRVLLFALGRVLT
jgi:hypothetical protein